MSFNVRASRHEVRALSFEVRASNVELRASRSELRASRSEPRGPRFEVRGSRFEVQFSMRSSRFLGIPGGRVIDAIFARSSIGSVIDGRWSVVLFSGLARSTFWGGRRIIRAYPTHNRFIMSRHRRPLCHYDHQQTLYHLVLSPRNRLSHYVLKQLVVCMHARMHA